PHKGHVINQVRVNPEKNADEQRHRPRVEIGQAARPGSNHASPLCVPSRFGASRRSPSRCSGPPPRPPPTFASPSPPARKFQNRNPKFQIRTQISNQVSNFKSEIPKSKINK